jgi:hypothetical protein
MKRKTYYATIQQIGEPRILQISDDKKFIEDETSRLYIDYRAKTVKGLKNIAKAVKLTVSEIKEHFIN